MSIAPPIRWRVSLTLREQKEMNMIIELGKVTEETRDMAGFPLNDNHIHPEGTFN